MIMIIGDDIKKRLKQRGDMFLRRLVGLFAKTAIQGLRNELPLDVFVMVQLGKQSLKA